MRMETAIRKSLGLKAHFVREMQETADKLVAVVERFGQRRLRCGRCGREVQHTHGRAPRAREWRDLRVRDKPLVIVYRPFRVVCPDCGVHVEKIPWAGPRQRVTHSLALVVAALAKKLSWAEVAEHFGLNWKTVAAVVKRAVKCGLVRRRWKPLHVIGLDEVSRRKGQVYLTLVYDLERGRLVWVGEGRDTATMDQFFGWLGKHRGRAIRVVCCDMWAVYIDAVQRRLPWAKLVFDRFHVVKHLNEAVDEVRASVLPQGDLPAFLGLRVRGLGLALPAAMALVGVAQQAGADAEIRPDDPQPPGRHPGLDEAAGVQRRAGRDEQQGQGRESPLVWLPQSGDLCHGHLACLRRPPPGARLTYTFGRGADFFCNAARTFSGVRGRSRSRMPTAS